MPINFYHEDVKTLPIEKTKIRKWITSTINNENKTSGDLSFIFCSDDYLLEINKQYLQHDYYTDIITFDYVEEDLISGDIFISVDRISDNASEYNVTFNEELNRIIIHGVLHLLGYKDKSVIEKKEMTEKEDFYLSRL